MRKGLGRIPARGWESGLQRRLWGAQIVFGGPSNPRRKRQWEIEKEVLLACCWFHCCWKIFQSFGLNEWRYIWILSLSLSPFKDFIYLLIFRGRSREGEREGERHQCERETLAASRMPPTRDLTHNPVLCPDWASATFWFPGWHSIHWATLAKVTKGLKWIRYVFLLCMLICGFNTP